MMYETRTLYDKEKIGSMTLFDRFVRSATYEGIASNKGEVTQALIKLYDKIADGAGLIITGHMYVHPLGKAASHQTGIYKDTLIPGLIKLANTVQYGERVHYNERSRVAFQLSHAGMSTSSRMIGTTPLAPSNNVVNPYTLKKPKEMSHEEILEVIDAFRIAALRAFEAEADAIQIHAAHGYLVSQFLSPFFNHRYDEWGGSDENRFRFLKEIIVSIRKELPRFPLIVKLNQCDWLPKGITPRLTAIYARWLEKLGVDAIEISGGTVSHSVFNMCRGEVPVNEIVQAQPEKFRPAIEEKFNKMVGKFDFEEAYNLEGAKVVADSVKNIPIILVGGLRKQATMKQIVQQNERIRFVSQSRPYIKIEGACISCNRCLAAVSNDLPIRCYERGFPKKKD
ncbi:MAG: NADH:flavin oxidoreductase [Candidatus Lokiarchaeota archaeon]|nr:NADH:flavin oxidoreductase [Candidatus Lokiarchaeota archaeon]